MKHNRTPTTSITEPVKEVSLEVCEPQIKKLFAVTDRLEKRVCSIEDELSCSVSLNCNSVPGDNTGERWTATEDRALCNTLQRLISNCAHWHNRSEHAIRCRLLKMLS